MTLVSDYAAWFEKSPPPKLPVVAELGGILVGKHPAYFRTWPNQTEMTVEGGHFIQEDSPGEIGAALAAWLPGLG